MHCANVIWLKHFHLCGEVKLEWSLKRVQCLCMDQEENVSNKEDSPGTPVTL